MLLYELLDKDPVTQEEIAILEVLNSYFLLHGSRDNERLKLKESLKPIRREQNG